MTEHDDCDAGRRGLRMQTQHEEMDWIGVAFAWFIVAVPVACTVGIAYMLTHW